MKKSFFVLPILMFIVMTMAEADEWKFDKVHSSVTFTIRHMVISEVVGRFDDSDVKFISSKDDFTDASIEAVIKVNSINTGVERRDIHLKSDDFFNAEKFPEIRFKSTSVEKVGDNAYKIHGDLTIRDITKPVTFDATLFGTIKTQQGNRAGWKVTIALNRFDYGLKWSQTIETGGLVAGDIVNITVNAEITK